MLWKLHQKAKFRLFRHNDFGNFTKKQNSDYLDIVTCDSWILKWEKR